MTLVTILHDHEHRFTPSFQAWLARPEAASDLERQCGEAWEKARAKSLGDKDSDSDSDSASGEEEESTEPGEEDEGEDEDEDTDEEEEEEDEEDEEEQRPLMGAGRSRTGDPPQGVDPAGAKFTFNFAV